MKNKKGEATIVTFILLLMLVLIGLAFANSIVNSGASITKKFTTTNESNVLTSCYTSGLQVNESNPACNITVTNAPTGWKLTEPQCALENVVVTNSVGTVLVANTDYKLFAQTGIIQFLNTTDTASLTNNATLESYTYCPDGYLSSSGDRSLVELIGTLAVFMLVSIVGKFIYNLFQTEDL